MILKVVRGSGLEDEREIKTIFDYDFLLFTPISIFTGLTNCGPGRSGGSGEDWMVYIWLRLGGMRGLDDVYLLV